MRRALAVIICAAAVLSLYAEQGQNQKKGFNAENVYFTHDIDTVNAFNANLVITIPIGPRFPVAEGFSYGFTAVSNSNLWEPENLYDPPFFSGNPMGISSEADEDCHSPDGVMFAHPHRRANAGLGWILTLGRLLNPNDPSDEPVLRFTYESPDGADHRFFGDPTGETPLVTRDGSFLRMTYDEATQLRTIEFPDGMKHTFKKTTMGAPWLPSRMENRFGAYVSIDYRGPEQSTQWDPIPPDSYEWRITDSTGRSHVIKFVKKTWEGGGRYLVRSVELQGFDGTVAKYAFHYSAAQIGRTPWAEQCPDYKVLAAVQFLDRIEFPADPTDSSAGATEYQFTYDRTNDWFGEAGLITEATLPTGARIRWDYLLRSHSRYANGSNTPWIDTSWGVSKRTLKPPVGEAGEEAEWTYSYLVNADYDPGTEYDNHEGVHTGYALTKDALGHQTLSFFSENQWPYDGLEYYRSEYGKPFTRQFPAVGGMFLSEVQYPPGVALESEDFDDPLNASLHPLRAKFVLYEADLPPNHIMPQDDNARVLKSRIRTFRYAGNVMVGYDDVDTVNSDWDNFGHYRTTSVGDPATAAAQWKTTTTNYNPHVASPASFPAQKPWILNTYSHVQTTFNNDASRTDFCWSKDAQGYPTTGFLTRKLTRRGTNPQSRDLLAVYTPTAQGNLHIESYYGGDADTSNYSDCNPVDDAGPLPSALSTNLCGEAPGAARYSVTHDYSNGVRSSSQYAGVAFKSLDLTIDPTGLVRASRDSAGVETRYEYNPAAQLRSVFPAGEAWTEYRYKISPNAAPWGSVTERQWPSNVTNPLESEVPLTERRHYYDPNGRLTQQSTWMGDLAANGNSPWSTTSISYDKLGRRAKQSVPVARATGALTAFTGPYTEYIYDALGRTTHVKHPGCSIVGGNCSTDLTTYPRVNHIVRSNRVLSINAQEIDQQVTTVTEEKYDAFGRLVQVVEHPGAPAGPVTNYTYDEGDRLMTVDAGDQTRQFLYDGAGLLMGEEHPESGTTSYWYDARGHVKRQCTANNATLITQYDSAERVVSVTHGASPLKSFGYDETAMGKGKLTHATRVNDHGAFGVYTVNESLGYAPVTGRLDHKKTEVVKVLANVTTKATFQDEYLYDQHGNVAELTYPACDGCVGLAAPQRVVENQFSHGMLGRVPGYTGAFTYHPNGLIAQFSRMNAGSSTASGPRFEQSIGADGVARPAAINVTQYCTSDELRIDTPPDSQKTVDPGDPAGLTVTATGAVAIEWYEVGSDDVLATGNSLTIPVYQTTAFFVRVRNATCSVDSPPSVVSVALPLPIVSTNAATSVTQTGATLNGTVNPNGSSAITAFQYGLTQAYTWTSGAQPLSGSTNQSIHVNVANLNCGSTYHYRAKATNAGGTTFGSDATFQTSACPSVGTPALVTNTPTGVTQTAATLQGAVSPNGAVTETYFDVGPTQAFGTVVLAQTQSGYGTHPITAPVAGLTCGTTYYVRARGTSTAGTGLGGTVSFNTAACTVNPCPVESLAVPSTINRTLTSSSCTSGMSGPQRYAGIFSFSGAAGQRVRIDLTSTAFDPFLYLIAPNGSIHMQDDDGGAARNSQINAVLPVAGTWKIHATTRLPLVQGAYQLTISNCGAEAITTPSALTRTLAASDCISERGAGYYENAFSFTGVAGNLAIIDMESASFDTYLMLSGPSGDVVVSNDDVDSEDSDSRIVYELTSSGTWTVHATSADPGATGTYDLNVDQVYCPIDVPQITAPASVCAGSTGSASAPAAAAYEWFIFRGEITSSRTAQTITFQPTTAQPVILTVKITNACGASRTSSQTAVSVAAQPTSTLSGSHQIYEGGSKQISATLTGTPPFHLVWSPGNVAQTVNSGNTAQLTVSPLVTTQYSVSQISSGSCQGTASGTVTVTVLPLRPTQVVATPLSATSVQVSWTPVVLTDDFVVERCAGACGSEGSWTQAGITAQTSFVDSGRTPNASYLYRVRGRKSGTTSPPSAPDVATLIDFGADVLQHTLVGSAHIAQLRTGAQAMATLAGLSEPTFTGANLQYQVALAVHLAEIRTFIAAARSSLGLPAVSFSAPNGLIRALDINEIRGGVR